MGLWSFLRSLWPWRARPRPQTPEAAEPADAGRELPPLEAPPLEAPEPAILDDHAAEPAEAPTQGAPPADEARATEEPADDEPDEDGGWEDEDDPDAPDPFINPSPAEIEPPDADLEQRRAEARAEALAGEHRVYLSMPAGPGSLAEALNQLSAEGLVEAEFVDDGDDEPHIRYRPATRGAGGLP